MPNLPVDITQPTVYYLNLWVNALASGIYTHTTGYLHPSRNTYCAYGVLCDLFVRFGEFSWVTEPDGTYYNSRYNIYTGSTYLPKPLRVLAGITSEVDRQLIYYNDSATNYNKVITYLEYLTRQRDDCQ